MPLPQNPRGPQPIDRPEETRLESWGEIASYLRREVRTVQRWEKTLDLPVRRLLVGKQSSVYAYRSELDQWYRDREPGQEIGEGGDQPFTVMEFIDGDNLKRRISVKPLPIEEVLSRGIEIADALVAAHGKGIIARDIKPRNALTEGRADKVLDFGLAKQAPASGASALSGIPEDGESEQSTRLGMAVGTASYMSPEQVRREELDVCADLFSFGVILYEMVTGVLPFQGESSEIIAEAIQNRTPVAPVQLNPDVSLELQQVINKALEKDKKLRYQSAVDIRTDLQRLKRDSDSSREARSKPTKKSGWKAAIGATTLVIALAGIWWLVFFRQPRVLTEKDTIVLTDFDNSTGDPIFDDTLKTALNVSLRQSPFLNVLSDSKVAGTLRLMTRPSSTKVTPEVGRELCQRAGSTAYIAGSIGRLGKEFVVGLKAVNCRSGDTLAQEQVTAGSKEQVLPELGQAASRLRNELGESLGSVQKFDVPLSQSTTDSLEALKAYTLAVKTAHEKGGAEAIPFDKRAIELDPNFALAYNHLAVHYYNLNQPSLGVVYLEKAFELRDRATELERFHIAAHYYGLVTGDLEKANQIHEEWIQAYPRDSVAYLSLGSSCMIQGRYEKAAAETRESLRVAPTVSGYGNLAQIYMALNRFAEARTITEEALSHNLDGTSLRLNLYALSFFQSNAGAMKEQADWATRKPTAEDQMVTLESDTEAWSGRFVKARELSRQAVETALRGDEKEPAALWQANAAIREALIGNANVARQNAAAASALAPGSRDSEVQAALAYALAGDAAHALSLADDLRKRFPQDTVVQSVWLPTIHAQVETDRKNPSGSVEVLQPAAPYELGMLTVSASNSCLYPVYVRAEAYLSARQGQLAAAEYQKILDHRGLLWNCTTGVLAHLGVARAYILQGHTAKGRVAYEDFLAFWKDADPEIPILKQAKLEYAKLRVSSN
jgi:eukaryotic-like serine/threonine-protein kinase